MKLIHNGLQHIRTINHHKKLVMEACFRLGLYRQGLTHDLSKYTWPELRIGIRYYRDDQSPHNGEREKYGYSTAWLHKKGGISIMWNIGLIIRQMQILQIDM